ncbi:MAG: hypothetical protein FWD05_08305 [Oscillospiraceae bacterium]|nr:hypothetical protein [Oscillospiraceae bacterium]
MKYEFNFTEMNYGSVSIESDIQPTKSDVINAIMNGNANYKNTEYADIRHCGSTPQKSKSTRDLSR